MQESLMSSQDADVQSSLSSLAALPLLPPRQLRVGSSVFSRLCFSWAAPLLHRGASQAQLLQGDLFELPPDLEPKACGWRLWSNWRSQQRDVLLHQHSLALSGQHAWGRRLRFQGRQRWGRQALVPGKPASLLWAIIGAYGRPYALLGLLKLASDALNFAGPVLLNLLLKHLSNSSPSSTPGTAAMVPGGELTPAEIQPSAAAEQLSQTLSLLGWQLDMAAPWFGYACAGLLALSLLAKAVIGGQYSYRQGYVSNQLRAAVTCTVFRKTLLINSATLASIGTGHVQTLMSVDADRLVNLCLSFHELWSLPLQIALALWLLWCQVRYAFLAGLGLVLLLIPVNRLLAVRIQRASVRMMAAKDRRVQVIMELLRGIRQVKCYVWERAFARKVNDARQQELAALAVRKYLDALCVYFWAATNLLFSLSTFGLFVLMGQPLTAGVVFTSLALFNVLLGPLNSFPWVINGVVEAVVSVKRVDAFLQSSETAPGWANTGAGVLAGVPALPLPAIGSKPGSSSSSSSSRAFLLGSSISSANGLVQKGGPEAGAGPQAAVMISNGTFSWSSGSSTHSSSKRSSGTQGSSKQAAAPVLRDITLAIPAGSLVAVTGEVGSGKSSLLAAILGEMQALAGRVRLAGQPRVAYVPQEPWVLQGSIRENILFGEPLEQQRYQAVLHACALHADLQALAGGDLAPCGGGGSQLSGGQRARVALARALCRADAELLLLDDCLAAVDAHVAAWLVQHALLGPLLWQGQESNTEQQQQQQQHARAPGSQQRQHTPSPEQQQQQQAPSAGIRPPRTVVIVTHLPDLLAAADIVVRMEAGRVAEVAEQPQLQLRQQARQAAAAAAAAAAEVALIVDGSQQEAEPVAEEAAGNSRKLALNSTGAAANDNARNTAQHAAEQEQHEELEQQQQQQPKQQQEEEEEQRQQGHVRWGVYRTYLAATGWGWVAVILLSLLLMQATKNASDLWLSYWVSQTQSEPNATAATQQLTAAQGGSWVLGTGQHPGAAWQQGAALPVAHTTSLGGSSSSAVTQHSRLAPDVRFYLTVLLIIAGANSLFTLARAFSFAKGGMVAAQRMHTRLLAAVLAATPAFFDSTPAGRILNRFSSDTAVVDDSLPFVANILLANLFSLAGVAVVLCFTQPLLLLALPLLGVIYSRLQRYYRATSRELRRLDSVARSPVYSHFSEALAGGASIRAYGAQAKSMATAEAAVAAQQRAALASLAASCWLGLRLQLMAAAVAAAVAVAAVAQHTGALPGGSGMAAGLVGLSLSYVLPITGLLSGLLTSSAETEQELVAVERVGQYLHLPAEGGREQHQHPGQQQGQQRHPGQQFHQQQHRGQKQQQQQLGAWAGAGNDDESSSLAAAEAGESDSGGLPMPLLAADFGSPATEAAGDSNGNWLQRGAVEFRDVWLQYRPGGPHALQGLSLSIAPGSKLGICGRTGAGKSSLIACMLRLAELSSGSIVVDGRDIASLLLARLRSAIGVVPQQPFLFQGSVRENLDPYGRHSDAALEQALRQVQLWAPLVQLAGGTAGTAGPPSSNASSVLGVRLGEGAGGLSQGQQQLLALARVLLQRPALLLLDECTASVDPATAQLMHALVREEFGGATVVEVAHRLASITDCDEVVIMQAGQILEQGPPQTLAQQPGSAFAALLLQQQQHTMQEGGSKPM